MTTSVTIDGLPAPPGTYQITRISDADPHRLTRFHDHDLTPGTALDLTDRTPNGATTLTVAPRHRIILDPDDAVAIWALPH